MAANSHVVKDIKEGFTAGLPIVIGYLPIAVAFGLLSKSVGVTLFYSFALSAFVYAGASQFMALNMLAIGAGVGEIIATTFLVNLRHFIMSASLASKVKAAVGKRTPLIAFGVTDEVFSVLSIREGKPSGAFVLSLQASAYISWVSGTIVGYLAGGFLPEVLASSMTVALYGMFAALLIPAVKKSMKLALLAVLSGCINAFMNYISILPKGWNMVTAIILAAAVGVFAINDKEVNRDE
ncbi:MAG: AzlC family ABC transporter permease [Bacillota bacterium]